MIKNKVYQVLAQTFNALQNCIKSNNEEWRVNHTQKILDICLNNLPSGSGVDGGTKFDFDDSKENKLVLFCSFHHMNENGMYDGWTDHQIVITPDLAFGFNLRITGQNRNDIKEYLYDLFYSDLMFEISWCWAAQTNKGKKIRIKI